ncbi:adenylate kinase [Arthrobacter sp. Leaf337]|nr:adenylate kinase [Arthrobacter sp. Leaf337]
MLDGYPRTTAQVDYLDEILANGEQKLDVVLQTPLGVEAKKYMDAGDFVPDSVTNKMVRDRLSEDDVENGFLLDGYPRTTAQVDYLDEILANGEQKLDVVLQLTADDEELVHRLLGRAKETGRSDDNEAVIRHRLDLYHEQTEAVVAKYAERGILTQVDGIGGIDEVTDRVMQAIKAAQAARLKPLWPSMPSAAS